MVTNTLTRKTGKPAVVFARKCLSDADEFCQELYKFAGANDIVPDAQLGGLIHDAHLQVACPVKMRDWLGQPADIVNLGGHTAVVSGVVSAENIELARAAFEGWAAAKAKKGDWNPIDKRRPRVWARKVTPARPRRLERETALLYPLKFPESPALQVTVMSSVHSLAFDEQRGRPVGVMHLREGSERAVLCSEEVAR